MSLLGPTGFQELGELIIQRANYAAIALSRIQGVSVRFQKGIFKEFVLNFDETGKSVKEINAGLLERNVFGGKDLSSEFPQLGQSALYCVTEVHSKEDIELLVTHLKGVLRS